MKKYILILCLFYFTPFVSEAQEISLYFMNGIAQSTYVNPSFLPERKVVYTFPGIMAGFGNSIGAYNDMLSTDSEGNTLLDTKAILAKAKNHNYIRQQLALTTFHSMYGKERWRVSISQTIKQSTYFGYPKGLVQLAAEGNAAHLDETLDIGPDLDMNIYSELAFGFMMRIRKWSVGGRIKLLSGIANVSTPKHKASIHTDTEYYQLGVETDYQINAAGLFNIQGLVDDGDFEINFEEEELSVGSLFRKPNLGIDLGANWVLLNDKLMLSASIIDLGAIKWKNNTKNYQAKGTFDFEGLSLNALLENGEQAGEALLDTLSSAFDFQESENGYTLMLPTKTYLSARYKAHRWLTLGLLSYTEFYRGEVYNGLAIDATTHLGKVLDFGLTGSYVYRSPNLGMHLALKLGPFQMIAATDNVLALVKPANHSFTTARFGMNLAFGKKYVGDSLNPVD